MLYPRDRYCVIYRVYGLPEVERTFPTEESMEGYCNIYLDYPDMDYVEFYRDNVEYTPNFWKEW
jgi:hypothetical protein